MNILPRATLALSAALSLIGMSSAIAGDLIQPQFRIGNFSNPLRIDNWLLPMKSNTYAVLYEREDGECMVNDVIVTDHAKRDFIGSYAGLAAREVRDIVYLDEDCSGARGVVLEYTLDWYAQDNGGNVWYLGEDTIEYEYDDAGHRIGSSREGSWEAGRDGKAGIVMFARPEVGKRYRQEYSPGVAEDEAVIVAVGIRVDTALGHFRECIKTRESTPLEPGLYEYKYHCPNLGLVRVVAPFADGGAELMKTGVR
ncbi:hypothetical protein [Lysobacter sp. Root494]|uniref:hypothetical protein n=1 Tax=Lysobacter sp. Root494 TaxID=1736549 RepID=UPI0006F8EEF5|nr:hypothetical protein [Lysobacter sp. Root494]KQY50475.1 hypothetical protein ASD14_12245 [Lysobacter sp. Root494]